MAARSGWWCGRRENTSRGARVSSTSVSDRTDCWQADDILWPRQLRRERLPPPVAMMKIDVEGFECRALHGMRRLLGAGAVKTVKVEVFESALRAQGCSGSRLQQLLLSSGFRLFQSLEQLALVGCGRVPGGAAADPDALQVVAVAEGLPYNLYGLHCRRGHAKSRT